MWFKLEISVPGLSLHPEDGSPLALRLRRDHELEIELSSDDENNGGERLNCRVQTEFEPSPKTKDAFTCLVADRLPDGVSSEGMEWLRERDYLDDNGNLGGVILPLWMLPDGFREFVRRLSGELYEAAFAAIGVLRWRTRTLGPAHRFSSKGDWWAVTRDEWERMPRDTSLMKLIVGTLNPRRKTQTRLKTP